MTLNSWFRRNAHKPLLCTALLVTVVWLAFGFKSYVDGFNRLVGIYDRLTEVVNLAILQKNRVLLEAILESSRQQSGANWIAVCSADTLIAATSGVNVDCGTKSSASLMHGMIEKPLNGYVNYQLKMVYPRFVFLSSSFPSLLLALTAMLVALVLIVKVRRAFMSDILKPLRVGITSDEALEIEELEDLRISNIENRKLQASKAVSEAMYSVAKQVAHDIRSPLSALNMVVRKLDPGTDAAKVLSAAGKRINGIANELLEGHADTFSIAPNLLATNRPFVLQKSLTELIKLKQVEFSSHKDLRISSILDQSGCILNINESDFTRVVSNLINNAAEASCHRGIVQVTTQLHSERVHVIVSDFGVGFSPSLLQRINKGFFESTKAKGFGLGLKHAVSFMKSVGGNLNIHPNENNGAVVILEFPIRSSVS